MASDTAMSDASNLGEASDVDSLASTAESDTSEYVVEDILAEREVLLEPDSEDSDDEAEYVTQYLVKWSGYPADSYTWESEEQFNSEETLRDWEWKKKQIDAGKKKEFNVKKWEDHCLKTQEKTQKRKEARRRERERRTQQRNNPQAPQEDRDSDTAPDNHLDQTSPAPQPASRSLSMNSDASSRLFIGEEIPPPASEVPSQPPERQESQELATPNAQITTREASRPILAHATTGSSPRPKSSVSKSPARPKNVHIEKPSFAGFGVPSEKRIAPQPKWMERGPPLSAAIELLKPSEYAARTKRGDNTPAMLLSTDSPESRQVADQLAGDQLAGELQGSITSAPAASSGETDMAAMRQSTHDKPPPAPYSLNSGRSTFASSTAQSISRLESNLGSGASSPGRLDPTHSSNNSTGAPPGPNPLQPTAISKPPPIASIPTPPTQPRAFTRPGKPLRVRTSLNSGGPFTLESPVLFADVYRPLEDSRRSSFSRKSPPSGRESPPSRNRSPRSRPFSPRPPSSPRRQSPRRRSPPRWLSPSRRSPRRGSPPRRRSPHRRSYSSEHSPPSRRPSPSRRQSPRRPSKTSFPSTGDNWRPDSQSSKYPPFSSKETGSANLQDRSIPNNRPIPSTDDRPRTTIQPGTIEEEPSTEAIAKARIARMPVRQVPRRRFGVKTIPNGYWWDNLQDELLMHVYFGPQKSVIGPLRLCGLDRSVKRTLIQEGKRRDSNSYEVWFEHLCTFEEFQRLCIPRTANLEGTAWVEGFADNNSKLFSMAEHLRADDLIAIHYPRRGIIQPRYSLIAWSHGSPSFQFPSMSNKELPSDVEIPLLVAVHSMLAGIESLGPRNLDQSKPNPREHTTPGESLQPPSPARAQNLPVSIGLSSHQVSVKPEPELAPEILAPHKNDSAAKKFNAFMKERNIDVGKLATIENGGQVFKASFFYLHFPPDPEIREELDVLSTYLGIHGITVHTNLEQDGWAKFVQNSKRGVVIFHESFNEYGQLQPGLGVAVHNHEFTFWVIRLKGPLQWMDDRYCSPSDHCTRIFPKDGMILLTEDMLEKDLKGVAVIIQWLRLKFTKKSSSDRYHLMLHPGILEWIERRLDDENFSKDHGLLCLIHTLIMKSNVTDIRKELFKPSSLNPDSSSLVVSHPVYHYGNRTEHDEPKITDKTIRDADHLIEFFAGWALLNKQRFRHFIALTSIAKSPDTARWLSWTHINVVHGGHIPFFGRFRIKKSEVDGIWGHLCGDPKPNATDQPSTPVIASTPGTPSWPIQPTNVSVQSPSQSNDTVQEEQNYPIPYE